MKTLNEVITGLDICKNFSYCTHPQKGECPYLQEDNSCSQDDLYKDALHYLKDMKNLEEDYDILYNKYWREFNQQQANPALTWDELKAMEGKPVWVKFFYEDGQYFDSDWFLVGFVSESFCDAIGKLGTSRLVKNDYWQAYRKEQFNTEYEDIPMEYFENGGI